MRQGAINPRASPPPHDSSSSRRRRPRPPSRTRARNSSRQRSRDVASTGPAPSAPRVHDRAVGDATSCQARRQRPLRTLALGCWRGARRARVRWTSRQARLASHMRTIRRIHTASSFPSRTPANAPHPFGGFPVERSRSTMRKTAAAVALSGGHHFTPISARRAHVHRNRTHDRGCSLWSPRAIRLSMSGRSRARSSVPQGAT